MLKNLLAMLFIVAASRSAWAVPADEVTETLDRAEALYYEADFSKSIELLLRVDNLLGPQTGHVPDKINVKLQLALAYAGLNDNDAAKRYFGELFALDSKHGMDPQTYSPKIIQLAEQARLQQDEMRCRNAFTTAEQQLRSGNAEAVRQTIASSPKCSALSTLAPTAADAFFKEGLDAYKKTQMTDALHKFRSALELAPKHDLAAQYLDLTQDKLQFDADRVLLAWRKDFTGGEYLAAAKDYQQLLAVSGTQTINEIRSDYRKVLSALVESWNRACAGNDPAKMEEVRNQVNELLPETSFAEDLLSKMTTCSPAGCIQMSSALALARLRTRVDPEFPSYVRTQIKVSPITIRVKTKISATGDVIEGVPQGGIAILHSGVRNAVEHWKFAPAVMQGEARCVETEIPIVITFVSSN